VDSVQGAEAEAEAEAVAEAADKVIPPCGGGGQSPVWVLLIIPQRSC